MSESTAENPGRERHETEILILECEETRRSVSDTSKAVLGHATIRAGFSQDEI